MNDPRGGTGEEDSGHDWLYATSSHGVGASNAPEETRVLPPGSAPRPLGPKRPAPAPPRTPQKRSWQKGGRGKWVRRSLWLVPVLVVAYIAFLVAVPLMALRQVHRVDATPAGNRPPVQPGTTYLLVGSDARKGLPGQRTDTIMLLHTGSGPTLLMSIPRDSLVPIPGYGVNKINAAFAWGGPKLLVRTIENNTHIRIDGYVEVGFGGFKDVIDALGGIQICPTKRMVDPLAHLNIKKGCQVVDGKTALGYARSRHTSSLGDLSRALHQRQVVSTAAHDAISLSTFLDPFKYYRLTYAAASSFTISKGMSTLSTLQLAWALTHVSKGSGLTCAVPIADLDVHWDLKRADRLFRLIREDRTADVTKALCRPSGLLR